MGYSTLASSQSAHAEGSQTIASGTSAHAEGANSIAGGGASHAEGGGTKALGDYSHSEGVDTIAYGNNSHAQGYLTKTYGESSHAGGTNTIASGATSFVHGENSRALAKTTIVLADGIYGTAANTVYVKNLVIDGLVNAATLSTNSSGKIIETPSDERLKHNITDLSDSLAKVNNLRGVSFEFNEEVKIEGTKLGFIAQEVNEVLPVLVNLLPNTEDMLTVDYVGMIPVLVEAVKELTKQNLELKARLDNANL